MRYELTDLGLDALTKRRRQLDVIRERTAVDVRADASLRAALTRLEHAVLEARPAHAAKLAELLDATTDQVHLLAQGDDE